jgi:thiol-disulfide isomerase/thioredoxin
MGLFDRRRTQVAELPVEGRLPTFDGATGWLNSSPLHPAELRGKVVLVEFWTYTCINWLRTLGYVRAWAEKYEDRGLVVVGVHTPEFPFEEDVDNVRRAAEALGVHYPIALDPDYVLWRAFANHYWPAIYIADAEGRLRHHQFGEGDYEGCERAIRRLLRDAGHDPADDDLVSVTPSGLEAQADWAQLESPETYLGSAQARRFASPGGAALDRPRAYVSADPLGLNHWALAGEWAVERRASVLVGDSGRLVLRYHARDVHLVMAPRPPGTSIPFRVILDGEPPGDAHGLDVDVDGHGTLLEPRLYQLIRAPGPIEDRTVEIAFLAPGAETYVVTFG